MAWVEGRTHEFLLATILIHTAMQRGIPIDDMVLLLLIHLRSLSFISNILHLHVPVELFPSLILFFAEIIRANKGENQSIKKWCGITCKLWKKWMFWCIHFRHINIFLYIAGYICVVLPVIASWIQFDMYIFHDMQGDNAVSLRLGNDYIYSLYETIQYVILGLGHF